MRKQSFHDRLNQAMTLKRLSQSDLSNLTDLSKSSISMYLSGDNIPRPSALEKLAAALDVIPEWLLYGDTGGPPKIDRTEKITPGDVTKLLHVSGEVVRDSIKQGLFPGCWALRREGSTRHIFMISPAFYESLTNSDGNLMDVNLIREVRNQ
ncbi:MAG: helix-turn-helix domain-containing protein [Peptococcaceae bacterium]|jgi:transcriptional regulator with XRE-family HTH domain|nr:helix-turn-helix domain-containing protein [Peptococcaceae bacterium]